MHVHSASIATQSWTLPLTMTFHLCSCESPTGGCRTCSVEQVSFRPIPLSHAMTQTWAVHDDDVGGMIGPLQDGDIFLSVTAVVVSTWVV